MSFVARFTVAAFSAATLSLCALVAPVQADTTFDTTPSWDGSSYISTWAFPNTATYGQTFIAPTDNVLQDFTFYINGSGTMQYKAAVFAWSGSLLGGGGGGATGPALYLSGSQTYTGDGTFQTVTTATGGTTLTAGNAYVAFLTISDPADYANSNGFTFWADTQFSHSPNSGGGGFVFYNNGNDFGALNTTPWDNFADFGDLAWKANFTGAANAVPEPGEIVTGLMLFGGVGLGILRARRKA